MATFGETLRRLRTGKGLSVTGLAARIGSHKGYVSGIENGKVNPPSVKLIGKIARALRQDARELILLAYVEKAPRQIRDEIRSLVFVRRDAAGF